MVLYHYWLLICWLILSQRKYNQWRRFKFLLIDKKRARGRHFCFCLIEAEWGTYISSDKIKLWLAGGVVRVCKTDFLADIHEFSRISTKFCEKRAQFMAEYLFTCRFSLNFARSRKKSNENHSRAATVGYGIQFRWMEIIVIKWVGKGVPILSNGKEGSSRLSMNSRRKLQRTMEHMILVFFFI